MTPEELEALLGGAEETDKLEFKQAMVWHKLSLAKDILAMANVLGGGRIIVGVEDGTFARQGLSDAQIASYVPDAMRDQVAEYADPEVVFSVKFPVDFAGRQYVVIEVSEFAELPVICKRDGQQDQNKATEVQRGTLYFRSRAQKPQSARVSSSNDLRKIIERAVVKRFAQLRDIGFGAAQEPLNTLDAELDGL